MGIALNARQMESMETVLLNSIRLTESSLQKIKESPLEMPAKISLAQKVVTQIKQQTAEALLKCLRSGAPPAAS
mgnify:CR=1 FL=1